MEGILLGSADGLGRIRTREVGRSWVMCSMDGVFGDNGFDGLVRRGCENDICEDKFEVIGDAGSRVLILGVSGERFRCRGW